MNQFYSERELSVAYTWVSSAATLAQVHNRAANCASHEDKQQTVHL